MRRKANFASKFFLLTYSKTCVKWQLSKRPKLVFKTDYRVMQVNSKREHSAILSTFIKLPVVIKIFVCLFLSGRFTQVLLYIFVYEVKKIPMNLNL